MERSVSGLALNVRRSDFGRHGERHRSASHT